MLWRRSAALALGAASAVGLARFAYGLLVPAMRDQLGWSLAGAGGLTTANGAGYLVGAAATAAIARRFTLTVTFRAGMVLTAGSLAATAVDGDYRVLIATRAIAGFAGALVFIAGGVIASRLAATAGSTTPITVYFSGAGLGIALSGAGIPFLLDGHPDRWTIAWLGLAAAAGVATVGSWQAARSETLAAATGTTGERRMRGWWRIAAAYLLFGAGYLAYLTFLSAYLAEQDASTPLVAVTWILVGLSAVVAPALWSRAITGWSGSRALAVLLAGVGTGSALPLLHPGGMVVLVSAIGFGATFLMVPAAVTALLRVSTPVRNWTAVLAALTVYFAAGQAIGPWLAGAIADRTTAAATLVWPAALCLTAAVLTATQSSARLRSTTEGKA